MAGLSSLRGGVVCGRFFSLSRVFPGLLGGGARRGYVDDLTDKLGKREAAEERMYFNKEDEKLLRGLLGKMKAQAETTDRSHQEKERSALIDIVGGYNMTPKDVERLLDWRHSSEY
ncbi:hypothetical protein HOP50_01g02510 [Chloropicon primus]|uniref:Uncharacterized protein n=1 Tax=Chloropicon primus TaxID=1764295 RepID=A0A5B8MEL6_9CHLO|nr:hypothetical protein A3770_01p02600 [Chloropicon primus]UPQ96960.1 hypothetical protein HOP50_01g02510 [Chloropicon primus]|mmetsp:Transcript_13370/g.37538  ORF Transcript_13370/g.37538 Transcript_13370/m.37538 type:complete len:116 (+) Transcript_13370:97-444(+)|eukprot:QDZ17742.1 hypothetical protein A3770_01p02600 [Chloropicon primus]